jgi:hypothetical protein
MARKYNHPSHKNLRELLIKRLPENVGFAIFEGIKVVFTHHCFDECVKYIDENLHKGDSDENSEAS